MKQTDKYAYSFDNERYYGDCDSIEEVLKEAREEAKGYIENTEDIFENAGTVYIGRVCRFQPYIDADKVIEELQNYADYEADEASFDYLQDVTDEDLSKLENMLTETFNKWARETGNEPNFFTVQDVAEYSLEEGKQCD